MNLSERLIRLYDVLTLTPFDKSSEIGRSNERYRLIALSTSSSVVSKAFTSLIGFITVPLTINYLGKEQFGLWMVVSSLVAFIQLTDFGVSNGLTNALAEANGKNDRQAAKGYFSSALVAMLGMSILSLLPITLLALLLPWGSILKIQDPVLVPLAGECFLVAGVIFVISLPISIVNRVYVAYQLGYITNLIQLISAIFSIVGVLIAIKFHLSLHWLVFLVSIGPLMGNLIAWAFLHKLIPWCRLEWKSITRSTLARVAHSSVPLFIFQIGALLVNQLVNVILARVGTLSMVTDYNLLLKIYMLIFSFGISFSTPFYAAIRDAYEKSEKDWVLRSVRKVIYIRLAVVIVPCMLLVVLGDRLILLWVHQPLSSEFGFFGWTTFLLCAMLTSTSSTVSEILTSLDDIWSQIKMVFLSAAIVILFISVLTPRIGLMAIYIAFSLSSIYPIYWCFGRLTLKFKSNLF